MKRERTKGAIYSGILHVAVFCLSIFGLPLLMSHEEIEEPSAITVEILPIAALPNVRDNPNAADKPADEQPPKPPAPTPPKPPEIPKPPPPKPPAQPVKTPDAAAPPPPKPKDAKTPNAPKPPEPDVKTPPPPTPDKATKDKKAKVKKTIDPLNAVLESLRQNQPQTEASETKETAKPAPSTPTGKKAISNRFDPNSPEALSVIASISNQVKTCWSVPAGARDADKLKIYVSVKYNRDGTALSAELTAESRSKANGDMTYRAAADSAVRAVRLCSPLKGMPAESYHIWQDVEIEFDPKNMLY